MGKKKWEKSTWDLFMLKESFIESLESGRGRLKFFHKYNLIFWLTCKLYILIEVRYFYFVSLNRHMCLRVIEPWIGRCILLMFMFLVPDMQWLLSNLENKGVNALTEWVKNPQWSVWTVSIVRLCYPASLVLYAIFLY